MKRENATNPPYTNFELDLEFGAYVAQRHGASPSIPNPSIKTIAVVGALFDKDFNLFRNDTYIIKKSLDLLRTTGISMAMMPEFHFYNLLAPISSDFMAAALVDNCAPDADAAILCEIRGDTTGRTRFDRLRYDQQVEPYDNLEFDYMMYLDDRRELDRRLGTSSYQQQKGLWPRAAALAKAKMVIISGGDQDEISTKDFMAGDFYRAAIHSRETYAKDMPPGLLGVAVNNAALEDLQKEVNTNHILGQRILALPPAPIKQPEPLFPVL